LSKIEHAEMKLFRTDRDGEIVMRTDGATIEWEAFRQKHPAAFPLPPPPITDVQQ
jgi:beta-lactamase superfamily II metal-dependent hydrolase